MNLLLIQILVTLQFCIEPCKVLLVMQRPLPLLQPAWMQPANMRDALCVPWTLFEFPLSRLRGWGPGVVIALLHVHVLHIGPLQEEKGKLAQTATDVEQKQRNPGQTQKEQPLEYIGTIGLAALACPMPPCSSWGVAMHTDDALRQFVSGKMCLLKLLTYIYIYIYMYISISLSVSLSPSLSVYIYIYTHI